MYDFLPSILRPHTGCVVRGRGCEGRIWQPRQAGPGHIALLSLAMLQAKTKITKIWKKEKNIYKFTLLKKMNLKTTSALLEIKFPISEFVSFPVDQRNDPTV